MGDVEIVHSREQQAQESVVVESASCCSLVFRTDAL